MTAIEIGVGTVLEAGIVAGAVTETDTETETETVAMIGSGRIGAVEAVEAVGTVGAVAIAGMIGMIGVGKEAETAEMAGMEEIAERMCIPGEALLKSTIPPQAVSQARPGGDHGLGLGHQGPGLQGPGHQGPGLEATLARR
jgi:hypothetical protein